MAKGQKTGGRQKGGVNKTTSAVKEALEIAFQNLGGVDSLAGWGRENQTEFYKLWAKLLPQEIQAQLSGPDGGPIVTTNKSDDEIDRRILELAAKAGAGGAIDAAGGETAPRREE